MNDFLSALVMIFILAVIVAVLILALIRLTTNRGRKIYSWQTVKHGADKLPYQIEQAAYYQQYADTGDWVLNEDTGKFTQTLYDGTVVTWENDPSGQVRIERQAAETGAIRRAQEAERRDANYQAKLKAIHNGLESDHWMRRVNRE